MTSAPAPEPPVPRPFAVRRLPAPSGVALLAVEGELDMSSAPRFGDALEALADEDARTLVLDLGDVHFMDSSTLKELLRAHGETAERGGSVILAGVQPGVRRLLDLTRTAELFELAESREAALARSR